MELVGDPDAPSRPPNTTGLFHLALLVPTRADLARTLRRVADSGWRLTGASDHLVSEALYLRDPEGNGVELYRDRPRDEWPLAGDSVEMATLPLDLDDLLAEPGGGEADEEMPARTTLGHVHLHVADLDRAESFWVDALGLDVTARGLPGALFTSAGGAATTTTLASTRGTREAQGRARRRLVWELWTSCFPRPTMLAPCAIASPSRVLQLRMMGEP